MIGSINHVVRLSNHLVVAQLKLLKKLVTKVVFVRLELYKTILNAFKLNYAPANYEVKLSNRVVKLPRIAIHVRTSINNSHNDIIINGVSIFC